MKKTSRFRHKAGFSLLELLAILAVILALGGVLMIAKRYYYSKRDASQAAPVPETRATAVPGPKKATEPDPVPPLTSDEILRLRKLIAPKPEAE